MCDPTLHIPIDEFTGPPEGSDLMHCYFRWVRSDNGVDFFNFFNSEDQQRGGDLKVGSRFNFDLPHLNDIVWVLNITGASCTFVTGSWKAVPKDVPIDDVVLEGDQSYQAQAGGTPTYEDNPVTVTATATA